MSSGVAVQKARESGAMAAAQEAAPGQPLVARTGRSKQRYARSGARLVAGCARGTRRDALLRRRSRSSAPRSCIPIRTASDGELEVLMVTTRCGKGLIFPKARPSDRHPAGRRRSGAGFTPSLRLACARWGGRVAPARVGDKRLTRVVRVTLTGRLGDGRDGGGGGRAGVTGGGGRPGRAPGARLSG